MENTKCLASAIRHEYQNKDMPHRRKMYTEIIGRNSLIKILYYNVDDIIICEMFMMKCFSFLQKTISDSKVHGANMGPTWGRQDPGGPHVGPMNFAIWDCFSIHQGQFLPMCPIDSLIPTS